MVIFGAGDHGKVVYATLKRLKIPVKGFFDDHVDGNVMDGITVYRYSPDRFPDEDVIIAIGQNKLRKKVAGIVRHTLRSVVDPSVLMGEGVRFGEGSMVLMGAKINISTVIGAHCIINTGSLVEHDCDLGDFVHAGPGSILCGGVRVGKLSLVGAGSVVLPRVTIGEECIIGAGSVVVEDVQNGTMVAGNPARVIAAK